MEEVAQGGPCGSLPPREAEALKQPEGPRRFRMVEQQIAKTIGEQIQKGSDKCAKCGKPVFFNERINVRHGVVFHKGCIKCARCGKPLDASEFRVIGEAYFCRPHYNQLTMRAKVKHRNPLPLPQYMAPTATTPPTIIDKMPPPAVVLQNHATSLTRELSNNTNQDTATTPPAATVRQVEGMVASSFSQKEGPAESSNNGEHPQQRQPLPPPPILTAMMMAEDEGLVEYEEADLSDEEFSDGEDTPLSLSLSAPSIFSLPHVCSPDQDSAVLANGGTSEELLDVPIPVDEVTNCHLAESVAQEEQTPMDTKYQQLLEVLSLLCSSPLCVHAYLTLHHQKLICSPDLILAQAGSASSISLLDELNC